MTHVGLRTAIVVNLDYESQALTVCKSLWSLIEVRMLAAGFTKINRRFVLDADTDTTCKKARSIMDAIEAEYRARGANASACVRDFYAVPHSVIVDLSTPVCHAIEVDMMSTGAFQKFFG